jgi:hypothetical protein
MTEHDLSEVTESRLSPQECAGDSAVLHSLPEMENKDEVNPELQQSTLEEIETVLKKFHLALSILRTRRI